MEGSVVRARSRRWAASLAMASLIAFQVLAGAASAAVPGANASSEAVPATYSAGNAAGFRGTYEYTDSSTLAKLFLTIETTGASSLAFINVKKNGGTVANACGPSLPVVCTFKQVRTNDTFVVVAAFTPAADATAVSATYKWSSTGSTGSDGGTSHGDIWDGITHTATLSTDPNFAGGFVVSSGGSIQNLQAVSASNRQATKLGLLPVGVAATVEDGPDLTSPCTDTATFVCADAIGEWSEVFVGDGQTFSSVFTISIVYYQGTPKGFIHTFGDPLQQEEIGPCPKKNPASAAPCFTWTASSNTATIYTFHNGSYRGR
jgi:hypothetical protein